ncbi:hypothetical protein B0H19DRAFT_1010439 [Mycena capillaripes]|nr:hypothetical protein B0H19DRAFT_1010439 [Mycena capillaripes]
MTVLPFLRAQSLVSPKMSPPPLLPPESDSLPVVLPPKLAGQLLVASLIFAGTTAVFFWDILHNLRDEYILFFKNRLRLSAAAYLVSRIASLTYVLGLTLFATYPLGDCQAAKIVFTSFYPLSSGATSLLFFFRVRAIYDGHLLITSVFAFLWVCVVGTAIMVPLLGSHSHAASVGSACIVTGVPSDLWVTGTVLTVHDTSVFLAISYRLLANSHVDYTGREKVRAIFRGPNLHAFSKALFLDGQKYYMIAVVANVVTISMVCATSISPVYRGTLAIPNIALTSIMACRVYRNAKLHLLENIPHLSFPAISDSGLGSQRFTVPLSTDQRSVPADGER